MILNSLVQCLAVIFTEHVRAEKKLYLRLQTYTDTQFLNIIYLNRTCTSCSFFLFLFSNFVVKHNVVRKNTIQ